MKRILIIVLLIVQQYSYAQNTEEILIPVGLAALSFVAADADKKEVAKEISQFRSKEYIMNYIIGPAGENEIKFETESLASDNSAGLISVAFNCSEVNEKGLLLAFFGNNKDANGNIGTAYGFRYIPLNEAQQLLRRINKVKEKHKDYMKDENDVNNVYIEYEDIKFILYRDGGDKVRVFWNGFEVIWERTAFDRTKRRLDRWFN
ncbi:hypothetical protein [Winogradskyella vincentii]|uniref:DUF4252 domain-containing protein n=1 Tax=Winogradskyella vincentii TaxID=2877122 RepID=A0ABS7Y3F9_9FLAO|nr:hypothetical protein [Winogradskyella vincentii]MCA0154456.1 hypothetical protein [Winogradskyella vincentii]